MMAAFDDLDYILNAQVSSYEAPLRVSSLVEKLSRDDRNVLFSYKQIIYPQQNADYKFSEC